MKIEKRRKNKEEKTAQRRSSRLENTTGAADTKKDNKGREKSIIKEN